MSCKSVTVHEPIEPKVSSLLELAWGVIANVGVHRDGWKGQHPEWVKAAEDWRESYHRWLREQSGGRPV